MSKTSQRKSRQLAITKQKIIYRLEVIENLFQEKEDKEWEEARLLGSGCFSTRPPLNIEKLEKQKQYYTDLLKTL